MLFAKVLQDWDKFFIYPRKVSAWFSDNRSSILFVEEALQNKGKSCFAASQNLFPFLLGPIKSAPILLSMETNLKNQRMLVWAEVDVKCRGIRILDFHTNNSEVKIFQKVWYDKMFWLDKIQLWKNPPSPQIFVKMANLSKKLVRQALLILIYVKGWYHFIHIITWGLDNFCGAGVCLDWL